MLAAISLSVALALGLPAITSGGGGAGPLSTAPTPTAASCGNSPLASHNPGAVLSCLAAATPGAAAAAYTVPPASLMPNSLFNQDVTSWPVAHDSGAVVD